MQTNLIIMKNSYLVNLVNIHGLSFSTIQIKDFILYFLKLGFKFSSPLVLCLKNIFVDLTKLIIRMTQLLNC